MGRKEDWEDIKERVSTFGVWVVAIVIDAVWLILWVVSQWLTARVIERLVLSGIDRWMLIVFQVVFGLATLATVALWIIRDILVMFFRTLRRVKEEKERGNL